MDIHQGLMSPNWSTQIMQPNEFCRQKIVWMGRHDQILIDFPQSNSSSSKERLIYDLHGCLSFFQMFFAFKSSKWLQIVFNCLDALYGLEPRLHYCNKKKSVFFYVDQYLWELLDSKLSWIWGRCLGLMNVINANVE